MGLFDASLRSVIEDPAFTETVTHYPLTSDTAGDGTAEPTFGAAREVDVVINSPSAEDFEVTPSGQQDDLEYVLTAMQDLGLGEDDRVWYDTGLGDSDADTDAPYRLVEPRPVVFDGDRYAKWSLISDDRGEGSSGGGSDPTTGSGSGDDDVPTFG